MKVSRLWFLAPLCILLASCGGSGGSGSSSSGTGVFSTTVAFNNQRNGTVDPTTKQADEATLAAVLQANQASDPTVQISALVAAMKKMSDFRAAGYCGDSATWGQFTDGVILSFPTNELPEENVYARSGAQTSAAVPNKSTSLAKVVPSADPSIPPTNKAYILDAMEPYRNTPSATIAGQLTTMGYSVTSLTGTLADWAAVSKASLLVAVAHGSVSTTPTYGPVYVHASSTGQTPALDAQYQSLLTSGQLQIVGNYVFNSSGQATLLWRYGITAAYLNNVHPNGDMFTPHSLMFNMACSGKASLDFFVDLQFRQGLSAYGGWSGTVYGPDSNNSALFFFDRTLGKQSFQPILQTSIPETIAKTFSDMGATPRPSGTNTFATTTSEGRQASFSFDVPASETLQSIIPIIADVTVPTTGTSMTVTGLFGDPVGTVNDAGTNLKVDSWTAGSLTVEQPAVTNPIQVVVNGIDSNPYIVTVASKGPIAITGTDTYLHFATGSEGNSLEPESEAGYYTFNTLSQAQTGGHGYYSTLPNATNGLLQSALLNPPSAVLASGAFGSAAATEYPINAYGTFYNAGANQVAVFATAGYIWADDPNPYDGHFNTAADALAFIKSVMMPKPILYYFPQDPK